MAKSAEISAESSRPNALFENAAQLSVCRNKIFVYLPIISSYLEPLLSSGAQS